MVAVAGKIQITQNGKQQACLQCEKNESVIKTVSLCLLKWFKWVETLCLLFWSCHLCQGNRIIIVIYRFKNRHRIQEAGYCELLLPFYTGERQQFRCVIGGNLIVLLWHLKIRAAENTFPYDEKLCAHAGVLRTLPFARTPCPDGHALCGKHISYCGL